ncbi:MAG TPA: YicC family protein [Chitinophagaceae bacterium]|nr:YicC family protein [Chitinophagaceae bacterium]
MLQSMTGFGRLEFNLGDFICSLEIRSLNGKQFEINSKLPSILKLYEINIRNQIQQHLSRGSIDLSIFLKQHGTSKPVTVNLELARYYHDAMNQIADELNLEKKDMLSTLMRMPEIVSSVNDTLDEKLWNELSARIDEVCILLNQHRTQEGIMLERHILSNIKKIESLCNEVKPLESNRLDRLKEKLNNALNDLANSNSIDKNRLEQEIIYYVERFDITEEKNRLLHHCEYFFDLLEEKDMIKGKKLGFLLQEIGREINTMGSKANDVDIQKLVVMMKDELEQAKEQLLNAL